MGRRVRKKFNGYFPCELLLHVFLYIVSDLFIYDTRYKKRRNNKLHSMNIINNILLSSKTLNILFSLQFKKKFSDEFNIDLSLYKKNNGFWKNIVFNSVLQEVLDSFENINYNNVRSFFNFINCKRFFLVSKFDIPIDNIGYSNEEYDDVECFCDKKAVLRKTKKENENKGRTFYVCEDNQCNFFEWEIIRCYCDEIVVIKKCKYYDLMYYICPLPKRVKCNYFRYIDE